MWIEIRQSVEFAGVIAGHPPCEDVDWNVHVYVCVSDILTSSSVWGCGLKFINFRQRSACFCVILRVRMWIEIYRRPLFSAGPPRHPPCEDVDWNAPVILGVDPAWASSSVWGCGLKCSRLKVRILLEHVILRVRMWIEMYEKPPCLLYRIGHPPCEDVDWNL